MLKLNFRGNQRTKGKGERMKNKTEFYWHIHHDKLVEPLTEPIENRIKYIKKEKPENERELRLKLLKKVKGKLPAKFVKAREAYYKAREAYYKAEEAYIKAREAYYKAREAYVKARSAYYKAWEECKTEIEKLHKKECGCKYWNGREIVFSQEKVKE